MKVTAQNCTCNALNNVIIEVTGLTGTLTVNNFTTTLA
ncbi:bluetail domain-containing putative surface protein [Dolichospermum planctonicum]